MQEDAVFLAYTAGFFDADGTVGVYFHKKEDCLRGGVHRLQTSVAQRDWMPVFVEWQERWGGSARSYVLRDGRVWYWRLYGNEAQRFLADVVAYLRVKRPQAELAIQFQKRMAQRGSLSDEEFAWQGMVADALGELKRTSETPPTVLVESVLDAAQELAHQLEIWPEA